MGRIGFSALPVSRVQVAGLFFLENETGSGTFKNVKKARAGRQKITCRVKGSPQWSATHPKEVVAIPPTPRLIPRTNPAAIPRFWGMRLCPIAMVTALEEMMVTPAAIKKQKERVPWVKKKRKRKIGVRAKLIRTVCLYPKRSAKAPPAAMPTFPANRNAERYCPAIKGSCFRT